MPDWRMTPDPHLDAEVARRYDERNADRSTPAALDGMLGVLEELAGAGRVVEFAVGTGRVALPLAARGLDVSGVDFSAPMLAALRAKPGAEQVRAEQGDMTTAHLGDDFALVYLVFNSIMNIRTQAGQVACFENAARHLRPGGRFVVEVIVPQLRRLPLGETIHPFAVSADHLGFDEYVDLVEQIVVSHHYRIEGQRMHSMSPAFRYVWPSELDLMARLAGLELEHRWADWDRSPFTGESPSHVSVWRRGRH